MSFGFNVRLAEPEGEAARIVVEDIYGEIPRGEFHISGHLGEGQLSLNASYRDPTEALWVGGSNYLHYKVPVPTEDESSPDAES